ncbi:MAG: M23 family metallopeptidase, partial [Spirochaetota bacterium]
TNEGIHSNWVEITAKGFTGWTFAGYLHVKKNASLPLNKTEVLFPLPANSFIKQRKYGKYLYNKRNFFYPGVRFQMQKKAFVQAMYSGKVIVKSLDGTGKIWLVLQHQGGLVSYYYGLDSSSLYLGESVGKGGKLGVVAKRGFLEIQIREGFAKKHYDPEMFFP